MLTRPGVAVEEVLSAHPRVEVVRRFGPLSGFVARGSDEALRALAADARVRAVQPDALGHASTDEAAVLTGARQASLELGYTGRGVRLAVLDTGVDRAHPDLDGGLVLEKCFVLGGCPPSNQDTGDEAPEGSGHGTHVAGIITGDGRIAPRGVAEQAELVMVRVFNQQSVGRVSDWVAALDWVLAHHAEQRVRVVNMSLGTDFAWPGACDDAQPALAEVVAQLRDAGVAVFAASGNEAQDAGMTAPACVSGVLAVGAVYDSDLGREPDSNTYTSGCFDEHADAGKVICFSNSSEALDVLAPGSRIRSSVPGARAGERRGTSQASPHAAAVAALLLEADPLLGVDELERVLEETGTPTLDEKNGLVRPLVQAQAALARVRETQCARREVGAVCELTRVCDVDAGTCATTSGTCHDQRCVIAGPALEQRFPAAGCSSVSGLLVVAALALLGLRAGRRDGSA